MASPPLVSVIVPVFNERATVAELLRRVLAVPLDLEVLVVDDGSSDGTAGILSELARAQAGDRLRLFQHPRNRGKGAAIRTAIPHCRGAITLIQDADLEYDPRDYPTLLQPILEGRAEVVYGSRCLDPANRSRRTLFTCGAWLMTQLANLLYGTRLTDEATCYKVLRTPLLQSLGLRCEGFEFCPELTARVARRGLRIHEVSIHYRGRTVAEGKKIKLRDAFIGAWTLLRHRFP